MNALAIAIGAALGLALLALPPVRRGLGGLMTGPGQCAGCGGGK